MIPACIGKAVEWLTGDPWAGGGAMVGVTIVGLVVLHHLTSEEKA